MSDDRETVTLNDGRVMDLKEYANSLETGHMGFPTEYDHEYKPITITDFVRDVFRIDLRKIKKRLKGEKD